jgi:glycosyltransferase involved in cell wall biosynthesis
MSGEPLALNGERPHRIGILSEMLAAEGHNITWWTTTFDHQKKEYLYSKNKSLNVTSALQMFFLHSDIAYRKNISFSRMKNHAEVARSFLAEAEAQPVPDVILCCFPTIDLAYAAVQYGVNHSIPVIVDVRDLWPDIFVDPIPKALRGIARLLLRHQFTKARYVFQNCHGITAVSELYLDWAIAYSGRGQMATDRVFPLGYQKDKTPSNAVKDAEVSLFKLGVDPDKKLVWFVGTFGHTYDLLPVIEAAHHLKHRDDIQFVFTGDGEKSAEWRRQAASLENIVFTGWVNKAGLDYLSSISSIGLMAYKEGAPQGLPNKVFEYMSAGLPILSSLQAETRDLLEINNIGFTYVANDVKSFLSNLKKLIDDPVCIERMGNNAQALFDEKYSSSIVYREMVKYLTEVIAKSD